MQQISQNRHYRNCMAFIFIYAITGIIAGLIFDILVTYLMAVSPEAGKGIASYMGAATFAAAALTALAPKTGYKKIMLLCPIIIAAALVLITYSMNHWLISIAILFLITGSTVFDVMLAPYIAAYTAAADRTAFFTKASYANVAGIILGTLTGGPLIVWIFSRKLGMGYNQAKLMTATIKGLNLEQFACYIDSYRAVLMGFAVIALLMLLPVLLIRESAEDYKAEPKHSEKQTGSFAAPVNKYVVIFLVYTILSRFGASLIAPNVSAYLTDIGIDRATVSMIGMLQYMAILIIMPFSAKIAAKLGQVNTIALICFVSVPFMLVLANGYNYGDNVELIVGTALFFRAGLANTTIPAVTSLTMELVSKNHRSLYASLVFITQGLAQISAGFFAKYFLFNTAQGYATAYYYTAGLYIAAHVLLLAVFSKKYNRTSDIQC